MVEVEAEEEGIPTNQSPEDQDIALIHQIVAVNAISSTEPVLGTVWPPTHVHGRTSVHPSNETTTNLTKRRKTRVLFITTRCTPVSVH